MTANEFDIPDPDEDVPPPLPDAGPTQGQSRIDSIDVLRGFALMGILIMNVQSFSMPADAYFAPTTYGNLEGVNAVVWWLGYLFVDMKFMAMFSMLFGAGIVLMSQHRDAARKPVAALHYRRMLLLLVFGLLHAYLLWYGDILVAYAICGMVVFWMRGWPVRRLIAAGAVFIVLSTGVFVLGGLSVLASEDAAQFYREEMMQSPEEMQEEIEAYRGSWPEQLPRRALSSVGMHTFLFPVLFFWRVCGLMLIGMALFKSGVLSAERSNGFYARMALLSGGIGLPVVAFGGYWSWSKAFDAAHVYGFGALPNWFGSVGVALMWVGLLMLFVRTPFGDGVKRMLGAYGRTAFTNYIGQTVIATSIFYGYGLGLFGSVERIGQIGIVVAIWVVQMVFSVVWLRYFKFGPLEWVWRSGAYIQIQPMLR